MNNYLDDYRKAFANCHVSAARNKKISIKQTLQQLIDAVRDDDTSDVYGTGDIIEQFEQQIAELFGKEAALFLPSGTMAQPIALKIWSETQSTPYVALHATSHLQLHEHNAYQTLYDLKGVTLGEHHRVPILADVKSAAVNPLAAVLLELPMREIGGQLPSWDELVSQSQWLQENNIRRHMDGARVWQCPAAYDKSLAEIAALFDSLYVSFYKDLGGIAGACLIGDTEFIAKAKIWTRRAGGNLYALYPYVIAAREGLKRHLPQIANRRQQAQWLASMLNEIPILSTWPLIPQTNMFRLRINMDPAVFMAKTTQWMIDNNVALITSPFEIGENYAIAELTIGDAFSGLTQDEWQERIESFKQFITV